MSGKVFRDDWKRGTYLRWRLYPPRVSGLAIMDTRTLRESTRVGLRHITRVLGISRQVPTGGGVSTGFSVKPSGNLRGRGLQARTTHDLCARQDCCKIGHNVVVVHRERSLLLFRALQSLAMATLHTHHPCRRPHRPLLNNHMPLGAKPCPVRLGKGPSILCS